MTLVIRGHAHAFPSPCVQESDGQPFEAISSYLVAAALFPDVEGSVVKEAKVQRLAAINNCSVKSTGKLGDRTSRF